MNYAIMDVYIEDVFFRNLSIFMQWFVAKNFKILIQFQYIFYFYQPLLKPRVKNIK